ncbi:hypothetical protein BH23VER1_BH23VER1_14650 [soil metagenome]
MTPTRAKALLAFALIAGIAFAAGLAARAFVRPASSPPSPVVSPSPRALSSELTAAPDPRFAAALELSAALDNATSEAVSTLAAAESASPFARFRWPLIFSRWLAIDRPAAIAFAAQADDAINTRALVEAASWSSLAQAQPFDEPPRHALAELAARQVTEGAVPFDRALAFLDRESSREIFVRSIVAIPSERSPNEMLEWSATLTDPKLELVALAALAAASERDPTILPKIARRAAALPPCPKRASFIPWIAGRWAESDREAASVWAGTIEPGALARAAMEAIAGLDGSAEEKLVELVDAGKPLEALRRLAESAGRIGERALFRSVTARWTAADPAAAARWLAAAPGSDAHGPFGDAMARWFETSPADAFAFLGSDLGESRRGAALSKAVAVRPQETLAWLEELEGHERTATAAQVARLATDGSYAIEAATIGGADALASENYAIAEDLWKKSPSAAAAWLDSLPAGVDTTAATRRLAEEWAAREPDTASRWIAGLPAGARRDSAIEGLLGSMLVAPEPDLERAAAWADAITDKAARTEALDDVRRAATPEP